MLRRVELTCYGAFTGRDVDLGPGLTVVLGPNESGKSTLRAAVGDLLWGLQPRKHRYAFKHAPGQLRVTADLVDPDDPAATRTLSVDSRGLWDTDGERVEPWWTGGSVRSREAWETALGLSLAALREGTQAVVDGGGDLQSLVYRARTGVDLEAERERLAARADELFKRHGNNKNVKVRTQAKLVESRRDAVAATTSSADVVVALREAAARSGHEFGGAVTDLAAATAALAAAERDRRCLDVAVALHDVRARMHALASAGRSLDSDDLDAFDAARAELAELEKAADALRDEIDRLAAHIDDAGVDDDALDVESTVDQLAGREPLARQAREGIAPLEHNAAAQEAELRRLLRLIDPKAAAARSSDALVSAATDALLPADVLGRLDREADRLTLAAEAADEAREDAASAADRSRELTDGLDTTAVSELERARVRRDDAWRALREPWLAGEALDAPSRGGLAEALSAAHTDLDAATERVHGHAEATGRAGEADEQAARRMRDADSAGAALERAQQSWADLLRESGAPATLDPQAWLERHDALDALTDALDALDTARLGLATSRSLVADFERDVHAAAAPLGLDVDDAWIALAALRARVSASVKGRAAQQAWERSRSEKSAQLEDLSARHDRVTAGLVAFEADDDLDAVLARSRDHVVLAQREADLLDRLAAAAGTGVELDSLVASLSDRTAAEVEAAVLQAQAREEQARARHLDAHTTEAFAEQELITAERAGSAAALRSEEQEAAEQLAALVDEFLQTKVQLLLLDRVLAADLGDDTRGLLAHAESLAQRLTQGRVRRLVVDEVDGRRRLRVDAEALTDGSPDELSEGTADQVYLALRLAGIREQQATARAAGAPALPVVLDDVLQAHDDARSAAAVQVLVDEAADQQIVLLTHHESVALAAQAAGASVVRLESLPDLAEAETPARPKRRRTVLAVPDPIVAEAAERAVAEQQLLDAYIATHDELPGTTRAVESG